MKKLMKEWREFLLEENPKVLFEQNTLLLEEFEIALAEGRVTDWISNNFDKLKPVLKWFSDKLKSGVEPFIIAVKKWKEGEELSEEEKSNFIDALTSAGIFLLPGGAMLVVLKQLVLSHFGSSN